MEASRHGCRNVDVAYVENNIHANGSAKHGWEDVSLVDEAGRWVLGCRLLWYQGKEQNTEDEFQARNDHENMIRDNVKNKASSDGKTHAANGKWRKPCRRQDGTCVQDVFNAKALVSISATKYDLQEKTY